MIDLSIVLVSPQGAANIGAAARAMKNFGFCDMRLVDPVEHLTSEAYTWALGAKDLLESAKVFSSIPEAVGDRNHAMAFTRRIGKSRRGDMLLDEAALFIRSNPEKRFALLFGREDKGLNNDQVEMCDCVVTIPTSEMFPSINLAQSVILACHAVYAKFNENTVNVAAGAAPEYLRNEYISHDKIAELIVRLEKTLSALQYEDEPDNPLKTKILNQFSRLFGRAGVMQRDLQMFEGLMARIDGVASGKLVK
ncbi:MAG: tRNA (cytidine/uridine-2'-O-)-methyltransferase TrmJ [bacterium ADurb.Bin270]|jgi:tRNA/rRNA methyltransferase|nr:MAG: tRNA (cytidine/uridine-2'-O-)-methyltransferase TrmJ [bacterium ADurb.Bin270]HQG12785.1 TrmJ/YjtD family RNA methyltransferase [bacterium]